MDSCRSTQKRLAVQMETPGGPPVIGYTNYYVASLKKTVKIPVLMTDLFDKYRNILGDKVVDPPDHRKHA